MRKYKNIILIAVLVIEALSLYILLGYYQFGDVFIQQIWQDITSESAKQFLLFAEVVGSVVVGLCAIFIRALSKSSA